MPTISDKIAGLTFAQKVADGDVTTRQAKSAFLALSPIGQKAAVDALQETGDPLLQSLARGLAGDVGDRVTVSSQGTSSTGWRSVSSGEGAGSSRATSSFASTRVSSSG